MTRPHFHFVDTIYQQGRSFSHCTETLVKHQSKGNGKHQP